MRSNHQQRIEETMALASQETPSTPTEPSLEVRKLRASLIIEEAIETIERGLGIEVVVSYPDNNVGDRSEMPLSCMAHFEFNEDGPFNMIETADGCADLSVVNTGTLSACGIRDTLLLREVDENNLAKFGDGAILREDGKYQKPPGHKPPDIRKILMNQGWEG